MKVFSKGLWAFSISSSSSGLRLNTITASHLNPQISPTFCIQYGFYFSILPVFFLCFQSPNPAVTLPSFSVLYHSHHSTLFDPPYHISNTASPPSFYYTLWPDVLAHYRYNTKDSPAPFLYNFIPCPMSLFSTHKTSFVPIWEFTFSSPRSNPPVAASYSFSSNILMSSLLM